MIEILRAIENRLHSLDGVRDRDIFITPHIGFIPQGARRPCVGIKDGKVEREYLAGGAVDISFMVRLAIFCDLAGKDNSVIGLLELRNGCLDLLDGQFLGIAGMHRVTVTEDPESELFFVKNATEMQRKIVGLRYELRR